MSPVCPLVAGCGIMGKPLLLKITGGGALSKASLSSHITLVHDLFDAKKGGEAS